LIAAMALRSSSMAGLSRATGIPYRTLQDYLAGRNKLPLTAAAKLADALRVSLDWIAYGRGATFDRVILLEALAALAPSDATLANARSLRDRAASFADFYLTFYRNEYDLAVTAAPADVPLPGRPARPPVRRPTTYPNSPKNPRSSRK
jgi:hypothetical protein